MARHNLDAGDHRASDGQSRYRERIALVVQQGGYIEQLNAPDLLQHAPGARADFVGPNRNVASVLGMASIGRCSRASVSQSSRSVHTTALIRTELVDQNIASWNYIPYS